MRTIPAKMLQFRLQQPHIQLHGSGLPARAQIRGCSGGDTQFGVQASIIHPSTFDAYESAFFVSHGRISDQTGRRQCAHP
ncbi:hypothetical protein [Sphingomonas bisphenolicum]|uniref:hypothetical protein n=1 Tax=Sphingomonas bisphenolicum TaxID=296544 RepID=UPI0021C2C296|nr:hypothetical protein [Sphingomonas bisphenolicum]